MQQKPTDNGIVRTNCTGKTYMHSPYFLQSLSLFSQLFVTLRFTFSSQSHILFAPARENSIKKLLAWHWSPA